MFRFGAKWVAVVSIVVATSAVLGAAANNGNGGNPKQPDVVAATVSVDQSTLFVYGENLSSSSLVTREMTTLPTPRLVSQPSVTLSTKSVTLKV